MKNNKDRLKKKTIIIRFISFHFIIIGSIIPFDFSFLFPMDISVKWLSKFFLLLQLNKFHLKIADNKFIHSKNENLPLRNENLLTFLCHEFLCRPAFPSIWPPFLAVWIDWRLANPRRGEFRIQMIWKPAKI